MEGIDPDTLLEWLQAGYGDERDLQLMALEQLCMLLLMSDNIDRCFESCPPRTFLPALCKIFLDDTAPDNVLEVTARAITYYLDVSNECTRRITQVDGAVKAMCTRLAAADLSDRSSKDLAEQCVKLLEHVCQRETLAVFDAGGLNAMLTLVTKHSSNIHKDTQHSAMSVVTRLCGKMEPTDSSMSNHTKSLGELLSHDDPKVAECALRCFAALTDRFMRKQMDPVSLASHSDLVNQLLVKLEGTNASSSGNVTSMVLSLLSNLCRGSSLITEQVLSCDRLITGLSCVLSAKEERCVVDGLRLSDLLLLLLCEGRQALPLSTIVMVPDSTGTGGVERAHRQLIDIIRQKDTASLIECIENGTVDVNYTDEVGQTLLNWAAAFGSPEMVVFLCEKGADVNKGHKSSSLHYAASFGRPDVAKLLLQRGANPDLRDEDGKTALDKGRERTEEDYVAVTNILENPSKYMTSHIDIISSDNKEMKREEKDENVSVDIKSISMDKTRVVGILTNLIPVFCEIYQKAQSPMTKRSSLTLLRKGVEHWTRIEMEMEAEGIDIVKGNLEEENRLSDCILEVIVNVLDVTEDYEAQEQSLLVMSALLNKDSSRWIEGLVRLGVFEKVESMASQLDGLIGHLPQAPPPPSTSSILSIDDRSERSLSTTPSLTLSDTTDGSSINGVIIEERERERAAMLKVQLGTDDNAGTPPPTLEGSNTNTNNETKIRDDYELSTSISYRWKEWRIVRTNESLFIWADPLAIEFTVSSNKIAFRCLCDGLLQSYTVNGVSEDCSPKEKESFMVRYRKAIGSIGSGIRNGVTICMIPSLTRKHSFKGWQIHSPKSNELHFQSTKHSHVLIRLNDEMAGFVLEHSGGKMNVSSDSLLDPEFHTGWATYSSCARSSRLRSSMQARRVQDLALTIWRKHLKEAKTKPREALVELQHASEVVTEAVNAALRDTSSQPRIEKVKELVSALEIVRMAVTDERRLSTFEVASSGLVPSITALLHLVSSQPKAYPSIIFKETFRNGDVVASLANRMVKVFEATEKFPLYLYDTPGGSAIGLQLLSKKIRMKLSVPKGAEDDENKENCTLLNRSGRLLRSEPLTTVIQLKHFLMRMVARQWFDKDRTTYSFVKVIKEAKKNNTQLKFNYTSDFDTNGIIYWLGTNGKSERDWVNPASVGVVYASCSDHHRQPFGRPEDILSRDSNPLNCHTTDDKNAFFMIDLGVLIHPIHYTMRHARGYGRSAMRNWLLQGSLDNKVWEVISFHRNDTSLNEPGSTSSWSIEGGDKRGPYRFIRISQNGENSSGATYYLSLSGFEIYGSIVDAIDTEIRHDRQNVKVDKEKKCRLPIVSSTASSSSSSSNPIPSTSTSSSSRIPSLPLPDKHKNKHNKHSSKSTGGITEEEYIESIPAKEENNRFAIMSMDEIMAIARLIQPAPSTSKQVLASRVSGRSRRLRQMSEMIGGRVTRGSDWIWGEQDGGNNEEGRIVGPPEAGWIDVQWNNGYINSYRYGADGKFDVNRIDKKDDKGGISSTRSDIGFTLGGLSSIGLKVKRGSGAGVVNVPSTSSQSSTSGTSIGKKSMSTTNLVDDRIHTVSVSATGQAASAESLQHHTPSLENILANYTAGRSMGMETVFDETREGVLDNGDNDDSIDEEVSQDMNGDEDELEETKEVDESDETSQSTKNLSVSAPNLVSPQRHLSDQLELLKTLEREEEEEEEEEEDDDGVDGGDGDGRSDKSNDTISAIFDSIGGEKKLLLDKLREFAAECSVDTLLADSSTPNTSMTSSSSNRLPSTSNGKKAAAAIKTKMSSYAEVLKSVMQHMLEPSNSNEGDDLEDEEMYDDVDTNEDELEEGFPSGIPVDSLASILGKGSSELRVNFRQLTALMMGNRNSDRINKESNSRGDRGVSSFHLRQWDDEFVLKCTFNALIPAFDPRPGRTNMKQTVDIDLPSSSSSSTSSDSTSKTLPVAIHPATNTLITPLKSDTRLRLFIVGPNQSGIDNVYVEMEDDEASIFKYIQKIANHLKWTQCDGSRRIWDTTYTLLYEDASQPSRVTPTQLNDDNVIPSNVHEVLRVLTLLNKVGTILPECDISPTVFISEKITHKLRQELSDPLVVSAGILPDWCERLILEYPCLFSVETRRTYLEATAFGVSRSIVWLQSKRDAALERSRGSNNSSSSLSSARRDDQYEYRLGRIKHERIKVSRNEDELMEQAIRLLRFHADRKAVLEIEYNGEEGTGLGPTLEFYALIAAEFQKKSLAIWMCDDIDESQLKMEESELDLGEGKKPPGYYIRRSSGLFPAPLPPSSKDSKRASELFKILGIFLAKVLQDGRLVDLPLSRTFLKLLINPSINKDRSIKMDGVLDLDDLEEVHPVKGRFLKELTALVARKRGIESDPSLNREAKRRRLEELSMCINGTRCSIDQLGLNFTVNPPSSVFTYEEMQLVQGGADIDVTLDNVDLYVDKCKEFYLNSGIRSQVVAFRQGFDRVFPLSSLNSFSPEEVQRLISGEQTPEWTREDIINYTEPKLGYTRGSPVFLRFVDVLVEMNGAERKRFLQFATGCSNLPPGGLSNLHPRLTIVRKVESGDGSYPSVNTCVHYLKLPEYSSSEILRERLLTACNEKGFHLN